VKRYATVALLAFLFVVTSQRASAQSPLRISVAAVFGTATADAATRECCGLRTPPSLVTLGEDDSAVQPFYGVDGRLYWSERTGTFVRFEASNERNWHFTYPRPPVRPFPFDSYEAERRLSSRDNNLTAGQTLELLTSGRFRPWLFGAFAFRRIAEHQHSVSIGFTDPTIRFDSEAEWHRRQTLIVFGGGGRVHLTHRAFVGGELSYSWNIGERCRDCGLSVRTGGLEHPRAFAVRGLAGVSF
jgi:hypothetical protein